MTSWEWREERCDYCGNVRVCACAYHSCICLRCAFVIGREYLAEVRQWLAELMRQRVLQNNYTETGTVT